MGTKSPTTSVKSREIIGVDVFSQRREVFDKHATVFLPSSPTSMVPAYRDVEPIVTSNHGKTTSNFKRNTTGSSSFRETKTDERNYDFRPRKYSDNFTSELNQSDDVDYRYSAIERTRRLSKMRRDFLTSNLHEPESKPFTRAGMRASLPTGRTTTLKYKFESPNLYKFPFAEPYATPPQVRRVIVDVDGSNETDGKENEDPELRPKHHSLSNNSPTKIDHQKLFEELVKRYSPQRKPIDWTLPPTKPRVVASVPKSTSSAADSVEAVENGTKVENAEANHKSSDDDVFEQKEISITKEVNKEKKEEPETQPEVVQNGPATLSAKIESDVKEEKKDDESSQESKSELEEKNDRVTELSIIQRQISRESTHKKPIVIEQTELNIPALIDKMTEEGDKLETTKNVKKVKRKRSFLDKLLGRKKDK